MMLCRILNVALVASALAALAVIAPGPLAADIIFQDYDANVHNRFDDDRMGETFVGGGFDWSGVGKMVTNEGLERWATMISDRHFVSADHLHPSVNSTVRFWENNSVAANTVHERTVSSGARIGTTDLWIGTLSSPLPSSIASYEIPTAVITNIAPGTSMANCLDNYADTEVFTVGIKGPMSFGIGKNRYDIGDDTSERNGTFTAVGFLENVAGDPNFIDDHETRVASGDSGAPSFQVNGSSLELVGIHSYVTTGGAFANSTVLSDIVSCRTSNSSLTLSTAMPPQGRFISYDNFVPESRAAILAVVAVPEPPAWAFFGLVTILAVGGGRYRRRRTPQVS